MGDGHLVSERDLDDLRAMARDVLDGDADCLGLAREVVEAVDRAERAGPYREGGP